MEGTGGAACDKPPPTCDNNDRVRACLARSARNSGGVVVVASALGGAMEGEGRGTHCNIHRWR